MDTAALQQTLNETVEHLVVHHGYTTYMRDYEVVIYVWDAPRARSTCGISSGTASRPDARRSWPRTPGGPPWTTASSTAKPPTPTSAAMCGGEVPRDVPGRTPPRVGGRPPLVEAVGIDFHEVHIETDAHDPTLLFSDLEVSEVPVGYAPFVAD
ncbi:hypothetical protein SIN09_22860 [Streptomyces sp. F8]|nr:hypothetical protein [Streptomyces sp. F8]MDX6762179.1 hypothetical protein [Streptomyces sp. F8]